MNTKTEIALRGAARLAIHRIIPKGKDEQFYMEHRDAIHELCAKCPGNTESDVNDYRKIVKDFVITAYEKWTPQAVQPPPSSRPMPALAVPTATPAVSRADLIKRFNQVQQELAKAQKAKPQATQPAKFPRSRALQAAAGTPAGAVIQGRPKKGVQYPDTTNVKTKHHGTFDQVFGCLEGKPIYERLENNRFLLSNFFCAAATHEKRLNTICAIFSNLDLILECHERTKNCLQFLVKENCVTEKVACNDHNFILIMIAILGVVTSQRLKLKKTAILSDKTGILYRTEELYLLMYCVAPHLIDIIKNGNAPRPRYMITLLNPKRVVTWTLQGDTKAKEKDVLNILFRSGLRFKERKYAGRGGFIAQCRQELTQQEETAASLLGIFSTTASRDDDGGIEPDDSNSDDDDDSDDDSDE